MAYGIKRASHIPNFGLRVHPRRRFNDGADKFSLRRVSTLCQQRSSRYSQFHLLQIYRRFGEASSHSSASLSSGVCRRLYICSYHETCPRPSLLALCANGLACCRNSSHRKDDLDLCMPAHRMNGRRSSLAPLCAKRTKSYAPAFSSRPSGSIHIHPCRKPRPISSSP